MTTYINLGVEDEPYPTSAPDLEPRRKLARARKGRQRPRGKGKRQPSDIRNAVTTAEVADILERRYHIFEIFMERHEEDIAKLVGEAHLEDVHYTIESGTMPAVPLRSLGAKIERLFKQALLDREFDDAGVPGLPTKASIKGYSKTRRPHYSGTSRPSFIDTKLYMNSFRAWVTRE